MQRVIVLLMVTLETAKRARQTTACVELACVQQVLVCPRLGSLAHFRTIVGMTAPSVCALVVIACKASEKELV